MRRSRLISTFIVFLSAASLAACGGGGGGGGTSLPAISTVATNPPGLAVPTTVPTTAPTPGSTFVPTTPPAGNTPPPTATAAPTTGATTSPTIGATAPPTPPPTPTPTPVRTATPAPTPTPTPPPTPTPTPTAAPTVASAATIYVGYGETNGEYDDFTSSATDTHGYSGRGDLTSSDAGATAAGGGQGGTVDGIAAGASMPDNYHIHFFLGIYANGREIAVPDAVGFVNPYPPSTVNTVPNQTWYADKYYPIHTHDPSGMVHVEAGSPNCGYAVSSTNPMQAPCNMSLYTFGQFLDIWGVSLTSGNFGKFAGPVSIYMTQGAYCISQCTVSSSSYSLYAGDPRSISLYSHTVIWIVVGTPPSGGLPNVTFLEGNP